LSKIISRERDSYRSKLYSFQHYTENLKQIKIISKENCSIAPAWCSGFLPNLDAIGIYSFLAIYKSSIYMESGSGNSTKFAKQSILDNSLDTRIISIDPCPRTEINSLCDKVIRQSLEDVDLEIFKELGKNDILFFYGSHRAFMNSDVTAFFLDILPSLKPRILVNIHDITLPFDYPAGWEDRYYSEQYLLACCLLAESNKFKILLPSYFSLDPELKEIPSQLWNTLILA
jgi:hypothetical protein